MVIVVMGVCGSGKTTVGVRLAERLGWEFYDADDFHSPENKRKMSQGIPLTDEDRLPWLAALQAQIRTCESEGRNIVLACSALREAFRRSLASAAKEIRYVYLYGDKTVIEARLAVRKHHYMNPDLLDSQFETLEEPEGAIRVDVAGTPDEIVSEILAALEGTRTDLRSGGAPAGGAPTSAPSSRSR